MAQTHTALGTALSKSGQTDNAVGEFKLALQLDPTFIPAEDGLAQALIAQKKYVAAIGYLKTLPPSDTSRIAPRPWVISRWLPLTLATGRRPLPN